MDNKFILKYIHFDVKKHTREILDIMFNNIFSNYNVDIITFECDEQSAKFLAAKGFKESIIRFKVD